MTAPIPDEGEEVERFREDEEIYIAVSAATKKEHRQGYNFENDIQDEKHKGDVCRDNQANNGSEDFKQQHGIFSLSKGFSLHK